MNQFPTKLLMAALLSLFSVCHCLWAAPPPSPLSLNSGWQLQDAAKVTETGEALSQMNYQPRRWYKATVPGTVLTSLVNDGVYPEPLYGENNRPNKIPESLCRTAYWYRRTLTVPTAYLGKHVWLRFEGINYAAHIWVNGHEVGSIQGAFARGLFDVTAFVTPGRANAVAVQILPPPHPGNPVEQTIAAGVGPNGGETAKDGPTFLCTIGWDWIPGIRDRDMGIWQGVSLFATGPVVVRDPCISSDLPLPRTDSADLTVTATVQNITDKPQTGVLTGKATSGIVFRQPVSLGPSETKTITLTPAGTPTLHVLHPRLWWPNGYGPQNLYTLHLAFETANVPSDTQDVSFGIRKITYLVPGSDNLTLSVNGVPIFCKGGDWGMDEALKRIGRKRLEAQIRMHQLANYTMIRNWVGQSTSEEFYELCDKYGILLWDEFFQPNPSDGPNPDDNALYLANVREKILRFRNHPSIALWCARNEGNPPPIIDAGIQALMTELEPQRLYQRSSTSGHGVNSGGPYFWRAPREYYQYREAFKTEIGSVSVPTLESVQGMMPQKDWNTINDDWAEHDLAGGAQGGDWYPHTLAARYGTPSNLADFVRKSQMMNYEAFRAMYEGRNAQLFHPSTGVLTWMSNPSQPSFVWQLYSWDLEPNASLFATRSACEPVHLQMNQTNWHVLVVNNTPPTLTGLTVKTSVFNLDGTVAGTHSERVTAAPSAATDTGAVTFPSALSPVHFVKLELRDGQGHLLSDNFYWRSTPAQEDDFRALDTLPTVSLTVTAIRHDTGGKCFLAVTLHNPTKSIALMAHVQLRKAHSNQRVLPVFYSDNYVSLTPGATKTLTVEAQKADLGGEQPLLVLDGWNVTVKPTSTVSADTVRVIPNTPALARTVPPSAPRPSANTPRTVSINCGGSAPGFYTFGASPSSSAGGFLADTDFIGGSTKTVGDTIDTSVPNAAPPSVYQSERWGACTYAIPLPPLPIGQSYTVRLHFAETTYNAPNKRRFNVDINGRRVLAEYDVFAEAGGKDKAVVRDFPSFAPLRDGHLVLTFTRGSVDEPKISGIQIFPVSGTAQANREPPTNWMLGPFVKADAVNPILGPQNTVFDDPMTGKALGWEQDNVFNPAAVVRGGKVCVLYRAEDDSGAGVGHHTSRLGLAESADGLHFTRRPTPVLFPATDDQKAYDWTGGDEDPRLVETEDGGYVVTYTAWNRLTARLSVATSRDLIHWDKRGPAFATSGDGHFRDLWSKSGAIVTRRVGDHLIAAKINGKYWMYWGEGTVCAATSLDLIHWDPVVDKQGALVSMLTPRAGLFDSALCESGPPAVLTAQGILLLYNGKNTGGVSGPPAIKDGAYSGGQALFDAEAPTHLLARSDTPFFIPERPYETSGQYAAGTVFLEGLVHFQNRWQLFYGTADSHVATATTQLP
jgi:predicted GH43/DUF377 family glycosyl hydrolase